MGKKTCKACLKHLPVDKFHVNTSTDDGYRSECIECRKLITLGIKVVPSKEDVIAWVAKTYGYGLR